MSVEKLGVLRLCKICINSAQYTASLAVKQHLGNIHNCKNWVIVSFFVDSVNEIKKFNSKQDNENLINLLIDHLSQVKKFKKIYMNHFLFWWRLAGSFSKLWITNDRCHKYLGSTMLWMKQFMRIKMFIPFKKEVDLWENLKISFLQNLRNSFRCKWYK